MRRNNLLRHWIRRQGEMPSRELLGLLWQEVALARDDANPRLSLQGLACRRYQGRLYLVAPDPPPRGGAAHPDGRDAHPAGRARAVQALENGWRRVADTEGTSRSRCVFRSPRRHAETGGAGGQPAAQKLLQEYGVPSWQRGRIPILYYGEQVALVAGLFVCDGFLAPEEGWRGVAAPSPRMQIDIAE